MRRIKLDYASYADGALLLLSQDSIAALTGNSFFPDLDDPSLAQFQTGINAYGTAYAAAADRSMNNVAAKRTQKAALVDLLIQMSNQLMQKADGNEDALISTLLPLTKIRAAGRQLALLSLLKLKMA